MKDLKPNEPASGDATRGDRIILGVVAIAALATTVWLLCPRESKDTSQELPPKADIAPPTVASSPTEEATQKVEVPKESRPVEPPVLKHVPLLSQTPHWKELSNKHIQGMNRRDSMSDAYPTQRKGVYSFNIKNEWEKPHTDKRFGNTVFDGYGQTTLVNCDTKEIIITEFLLLLKGKQVGKVDTHYKRGDENESTAWHTAKEGYHQSSVLFVCTAHPAGG